MDTADARKKVAAALIAGQGNNPRAPKQRLPMLAGGSPLVAETYRQFPWAQKAGVNVIDSRSKGDPQGYRGLEYYRPGESDSPTPGQPTVEVFGKDVGPKDLMGDILSHNLAQSDPWVNNFRSRILGSMTPDQIESIHGDYARDLKAGRIEGGDSFETWLGKQGGDSFFRGYPTGQWSPNDYNDTQKTIYGQMNDYLNKRMGPR